MEQQPIPEQLSRYFQGRQLLKAYSELSKKLKNNQAFVKSLLEFLTSEHTKMHFNVITILHPVLIDVFPQLSKELQEEIRGGLLTAITQLHTDLKCVAALGLLIRQILEIDGAQAWMQPFSELLSWVSSDDVVIMQAGIQFFIYLLKQTVYTSSNTELPLFKMAHPLLQTLFQIFAQSELTQKIRQKLLFLVLQIIKTFSIYDGSKDSIVKQCFEGTYQIWMSLFVSALQSSLHLHLTIKKYIMKNLIVIYRDMPKYSQSSLNQYLGTIWEFTYKMIPMYLHSVAWNKPLQKYPGIQIKQQIKPVNLYFDEEPESNLPVIQSLAHCCIEFISVITSTPTLTNITRISIHHITNTLFHYLLFTTNDLSQWENNPSHFITYGNMVQATENGVRSKIIPILNQLIEKYGDLSLQAILVICQKFLMSHPEAHTTELINGFFENYNFAAEVPESLKEKVQSLIKLSSCDAKATLKVQGQSWRKIQVALSILARFAQDIIVFQSKQQASFDIESFVKGLINQIKDQQYFPLLKGQSMYCLTRFTQIISIKYKDLFRQLMVVSTFCILPDMPLSVKVVGCKAFTTFNRKIDKHKLKIGKEEIEILIKNQPAACISSIDLQAETINPIMEALVELSKLSSNIHLSQEFELKNQLNIFVQPSYLLQVFHRYNSHQSTMQLFFNLLNMLCSISAESYFSIFQIFSQFINQCLKAYINVIKSEQKRYLKNMDTDLIIQVLKISNVLIQKSEIQEKIKTRVHQDLIKNIFPLFCHIIAENDDVQIHIATTVCIKNLIRNCHKAMKENDCNQKLVEVIRNLLKIPIDKTFEAAALYTGNMAILVQTLMLPKTNYQILQQAVLKVFKSRTPSVIQSLILIYSRMINMKTNKQNTYNLEIWKDQLTDIIDFLASFSIENRMGLKILIDKWLLQQSLFRGKFTKTSTFMALSKLFLLRDKRIDNLLVIGFNPSHTQVCNDVNAPLKILATLIRCLENQMGGRNFDEQDEDQQEMGMLRQQSDKLQVDLEKFKQEEPAQVQAGGLADRQNQQGSTCYMSAMLQFYDDGQECDQTTEEDLVYLKDSSVDFELKQYLLEFFNYLNDNHQEYLKQCLKGLLKSDVKSLKKFVNVSI